MLKMLLVSVPQPSALLWQQLCHPAGICLHCWVNSSFSTDRRASLLAEVCQGSTGQQETRISHKCWGYADSQLWHSCSVKFASPFPTQWLSFHCCKLRWERPFVPVEHTGEVWCRTKTPPKHGKVPPVFLISHCISLFRASLLAIWL